MRLPKFGFTSRVNDAFKEVNVKNINGMKEVTIEILKAEKIIGKYVNKVKIFGNTELDSKVVVKGINVTKGAKKIN
jgi:large subunit ribosomal protein L15